MPTVRDTTALLVTAEDVAVFYDRCGDTSLAARKQALASLTGTYPFSTFVCSLPSFSMPNLMHALEHLYCTLTILHHPCHRSLLAVLPMPLQTC